MCTIFQFNGDFLLLTYPVMSYLSITEVNSSPDSENVFFLFH